MSKDAKKDQKKQAPQSKNNSCCAPTMQKPAQPAQKSNVAPAKKK